MSLFSRAKSAQSVPEEFLDLESGQVKTEALIEAYNDLKQRNQGKHSKNLTNSWGFSQPPTEKSSVEEWSQFRQMMGIPETSDGYQIIERDPMFSSEPSINARLHQAGFTSTQVQLVYDLAVEIVLPLLKQGDDADLKALSDHFGGSERWTEMARQIMAWGKANLEPHIYDVLDSSADGIKAMRAMMENQEPDLGRMPQSQNAPLSEADLKRMIKDPRYWKQRDPQWIDRVSEGFRRINSD